MLSGCRRQKLIARARRRQGTIIEDDDDAEFRYDRDPVGSLQRPAPALCLGPLAQGKYRGSPGRDQLALATLIESGRYDRQLCRLRAEYASRREILVTSRPLACLTCP